VRFPFDREWFWGLLALFAVGGFWAADPGGGVTGVREGAFELLGESVPRPATPATVAVVDIDRESLVRIGAWPWRRASLAELIDKVAAQRPRAIAVDILLAGVDRKGPAALARDLLAASGRNDLTIAGLQDDDEVLAGSIAKAGNVVLGLVLDPAGSDPAPIPPTLAVEGSAEGITPRASPAITAPLERLGAGAAGIGVLSFQDGPLGRVRSAPVLALAGGEAFPGLAVETVRIAQGASLLVLKNQPPRLEVGDIDVAMDSQAEMRLHLSPAAAWRARTVPAWAVLADPGAHRAALEGKAVVIGSSAPEAGAFLPVAGAALMPTVQIQAEAIEQILSGHFLLRPGWALGWEIAALILLGAAAVALAARLAPGWAAFAATLLVLGWGALASGLFARRGLLIDPVGPALAVVVAGNVTALVGFIRTRSLKAAIQQKFERYLPPAVVARFLREPGSLKLDGELREVTALLTDVEGFSRATEAASPKMLVSVLDGYFDCVTELVVSHGGMVDKIVGDAVLAFFNIPAELPDHPQAAVRCAEAIVAATEAFRRQPDAAAIGFGRTRCGIETGVAIVGDVGGRRRLDYTAYGVVVNKAARFQEANKLLGSAICIGPAAAGSLAGRVALRFLGEIEVRGMQGRCRVFEPWRDDVPPELRDAYRAAAELSETDPGEARSRFAALALALPEDPVVAGWQARLAG